MSVVAGTLAWLWLPPACLGCYAAARLACCGARLASERGWAASVVMAVTCVPLTAVPMSLVGLYAAGESLVGLADGGGWGAASPASLALTLSGAAVLWLCLRNRRATTKAP